MRTSTINPSIYSKIFKKINSQLENIKSDVFGENHNLTREYEQIVNILELINSTECSQVQVDKLLQVSLTLSDEQIHNFLSNENKYLLLNCFKSKDKRLLKKLGISAKYVEMNSQVINKTGVMEQAEFTEMENIYAHNASLYQQCLGFDSELQNQQERIQGYLATSKNASLQEGCLYAICPISGELLSSNTSFPYDATCVYRFVGKEVFYLILTGPACTKHCIYLPKYQIILPINKIKTQEQIDYIKLINTFNFYLIKFREKVFKYLNSEQKLTAALIDSGSIAHYVINNLSGVEALKSSLLKADKILVRGTQYYGSIAKIFPELQEKTIEIIKGDEEVLLEKALTENLFIVKTSHYHYVTEELATRILSLARQECSTDFLNHLQEIKNKHFPIIFITWRLHRRRWLSQVEGIINILNALAEGYPDLAVVFDGYSRIASEKDTPELIQAIDKEKQAVQKVTNSVNPKVQIYDSIGCTVQESLMWANISDFYFASVGSGLAKVSLINNKPGITHEPAMSKKDQTKSYYAGEWSSALWRENCQMPLCIPKNFIKDYPSKSDNLWTTIDYDFDWRIAYKEMLKLIPLVRRNCCKRV